MQNYTIRTMVRNEIDLAIDWAAKEGWNPGLHDADCYFAADPKGFLIGLLSGRPIASISVIKYDEGFGFLGFYIVAPEFRGQGYGILIWNAGLEYLGGRNIGLDGVVEQQEKYRKSGFKLAYKNVRYQGTGGGDFPEEAGIVNLSSLPLETVFAYDRPFFPAERRKFLQSWIRQPGGCALGVFHAGKLSGYGVMRPCRTGYKIGPLYADTPSMAEALFLGLKSKVNSNDAIFLDVPEVNSAAVKLAERYAMKVSFETARMYNRGIPDLPVKKTFGVCSFEVG